MKIKPTFIAVASVVLFAISFGAAAKNKMEITDCVCDNQGDGTYDCTIDFVGASPATLADYHAHVTTEQDGFAVLDPFGPASCKAQTDCQFISEPDDFVAVCTGAPLPDPVCTALLQEGFIFSIVAKVAADADPEAHGKAKRVLKDNYPNCTINDPV